MWSYLARRLAAALALVFVVASGALLLAELAPGDAATELVRPGVSAATVAAERARLGLDRPFLDQYAGWLARAARLDFGESFRYRRPVGELVRGRLANTALLAVVALALATAAGLGLGLVAGARRPGAVTGVIGAGSLAALSLPSLLGALLAASFAARTGWFPIGGMTSPGHETLGLAARAADVAWHLALPALALALPIAATLERLASAALGETLGEPFVRAAVARGVPWRRVVWRHALPVAIRPVLGVYGVIVGSVLSGSFVVEYVSAWPGLGRLMYDALVARDTYLVAGCAAAGAACLAAGNLLADAARVLTDPRLGRAG